MILALIYGAWDAFWESVQDLLLMKSMKSIRILIKIIQSVTQILQTLLIIKMSYSRVTHAIRCLLGLLIPIVNKMSLSY